MTTRRYFLTNLQQPLPLGKKFRLLLRNLWRRAYRLQPCCGHPGEPGC